MSAAVDAPATSGAAPGATGTVQLRFLIDRDWVPGNGGHLTSVNPSRPEEIAAEGGPAVLADLDRAVLAARGALPSVRVLPSSRESSRPSASAFDSKAAKFCATSRPKVTVWRGSTLLRLGAGNASW